MKTLLAWHREIGRERRETIWYVHYGISAPMSLLILTFRTVMHMGLGTTKRTGVSH